MSIILFILNDNSRTNRTKIPFCVSLKKRLLLCRFEDFFKFLYNSFKRKKCDSYFMIHNNCQIKRFFLVRGLPWDNFFDWGDPWLWEFSWKIQLNDKLCLFFGDWERGSPYFIGHLINVRDLLVGFLLLWGDRL